MRFSLGAMLAPALVMASTAYGGGLGEMNEAEREAFRAEVKAYLLQNPDVLVEAMNVLQDRQAESEAAGDLKLVTDNADRIFKDGDSWVGGNPNGDVTVVEFMDYRCGYCRKAYGEIEELVKSDGNIRLIMKEFPILGADSMTSARFAISVRQLHGDDAYKAAHDALITLRGDPDEAGLTRLAQELKLDPKPILDNMASDAVTNVIAANHALADTMQISGTPTFVVDKIMLRGYVPLDGMRQIVAEQRKDG